MSFAIDASSLAGVRAVVFEHLYLDGAEVASHADRADDEQSVSFVGIGTTALGAASGTHEEQASEQTLVVDTVAYRGLTPGAEYVLTGTLVDASSGEALTDGSGAEVTASTTFVPATPDGSAEVTFSIDASLLAGTSVVAFERLERDGVEIAVHADLEDEGQTVDLIGIGTEAVDASSGTRVGIASETACIVDTVSYRGLDPNAEYRLEGVLVDAQDGAVVTDPDGKAVTAETTFVPQGADGSVEVVYTFDASALAGRKTVVFETLHRGDVAIASHADLEDEGQTVSWREPERPFIPRLGDLGAARGLGAAIVGGCLTMAGALALVALRRRREATC